MTDSGLQAATLPGRPISQHCAQMGGTSLPTYCGGLGACGVD
jgi:hypothetical protein